jgi:membrane protein DedA with SNARE-associated domain/rhodanese-related sulfurtransferase
MINASSQLTYTGVLLAVFANQICLPIPSVLFLMAAGALAAQGKMRASIVLILSVAACLAADWIWFWLGRRWGSQAIGLLCRFASDPKRCASDAREQFRRYGLAVVCIAKFLPGVDGIMPPLVGAEGVPLAGFLILDAIGSAVWSAGYVGLGYVCSDQLEVAMGWARHFGAAVVITIATTSCVYAGWRGLTLVRMIRRLQVRHISAAMLHRKLKSKSKVAVLDLLDFELEIDDQAQAIPGALRVDPSRLYRSPEIDVPENVEIILYSSSGRDTVCARAALGLHKIGIRNIWVLEGGLKAWREKGLPVAPPEIPETVAERIGVKLPE